MNFTPILCFQRRYISFNEPGDFLSSEAVLLRHADRSLGSLFLNSAASLYFFSLCWLNYLGNTLNYYWMKQTPFDRMSICELNCSWAVTVVDRERSAWRWVLKETLLGDISGSILWPFELSIIFPPGSLKDLLYRIFPWQKQWKLTCLRNCCI